MPCDLVPNIDAYRKLEEAHPDRVVPIYSPVDLTKPQVALNDAVLVLAGMMHHIPIALRPAVLKTLTQTNSQVAIYEPLLRTWMSMFMALQSFFPALWLPITFFNRPGKLRRILWCWLIPIVPYMFAVGWGNELFAAMDGCRVASSLCIVAASARGDVSTWIQLVTNSLARPRGDFDG